MRVLSKGNTKWSSYKCYCCLYLNKKVAKLMCNPDIFLCHFVNNEYK